MAEDEILDAPDETPSEDAPAEETETPSETTETGDEPEASDDEEAEKQEDELPKRTSSAWANWEKKFLHIKDPEERQEAMAAAWWEKNNFASKTLKENAALKRQLDEALKKSAPPKEPEEPAAPPQELVELDTRIQQLYQQDQALIKETEQALVSLNDVDTSIAKFEAKLEDAKEAGDDNKVVRLEAQLAAAQVRREGVLREYKATIRERQSIARDYEKVGKERIWLESVLKDRAHRQALAKQEAEEFKSDFPEQVDRLIESAASRFNIPAHLLEELQEETNDGLMVDLWKLGEANLDDVDLPALVRQRVERFAKTRNIAERRKFAETSKAKLAVASGARPAAPSRAPGKPVAPASMTNDSSPKMKKAREYLTSRGF